MTFLNIAAYKFIALQNLSALKTTIFDFAHENNLCGTVLLSPEGINIMLAGEPLAVKNFQEWIKINPLFDNLTYKENLSALKPFKKLLVKIKKEIIAFGIDNINPIKKQAPYIEPLELKKLLQNPSNDIVLLDTRNTYEIDYGTFKQAQHLDIQHFRDFPQAAKTLDPALKNKTVITFCTGGIRCEKAALLLQEYGFNHVYQLNGGILEYFEHCDRQFYEGKCYVFDERIAV